jgi:coenzyme F420-0:L-glutamate ligase / coenzyme F420-1:gamma-L-glutamate ligase
VVCPRFSRLELTALDGVPEVAPGADLATIVLDALRATGLALEAGDALVLAQKIVSKAEGRYVDLATVVPSARAHELAARCGKDPRVIECVLGESTEVMRCVPGVIVVRHRLGHVLANAGIDESNLAADGAAERVLRLPVDPDASCMRLRTALRERTGVDPGVLVNDTLGRAWRIGVAGAALGVSGLPAVVDLRGRPDRRGRPLRITQVAAADELAAAASLVMGQAAEGTPIVHVRGLALERRDGSACELLRPIEQDLFR